MTFHPCVFSSSSHVFVCPQHHAAQAPRVRRGASPPPGPSHPSGASGSRRASLPLRQPAATTRTLRTTSGTSVRRASLGRGGTGKLLGYCLSIIRYSQDGSNTLTLLVLGQGTKFCLLNIYQVLTVKTLTSYEAY